MTGRPIGLGNLVGRAAGRVRREAGRRQSARHSQRFFAAATKPTVLFVVDAQGWAHDFKARALSAHLADTLDCHVVYERFVRSSEVEQADCVVVFSWSQVRRSRFSLILDALRRHRAVAIGFTSHPSVEDRQLANAVLDEYASVTMVNSRLLFEELGPHVPVPMYETPNGVDSDLFAPRPNSREGGPLRVGWAGSLTNHGDNRGYHDIIVPAVERVEGVELVTADRETRWRSQAEMADWYHTIDIYVCASRAEGTPNPCLEAAACGKPIVTTPVGNMPEFVDPGVNGLIIERSVDSLVDALAAVRDQPDLRASMGVEARRRAEAWDWKHQSEAYRSMLNELVDRR